MKLLATLALSLVLVGSLWAGTYTVVIETTPEEDEALTLMYHRECVERRDGAKNDPAFDPSDATCQGKKDTLDAYIPYRFGNTLKNEIVIVNQVKAGCDSGLNDKKTKEGAELCAVVGK